MNDPSTPAPEAAPGHYGAGYGEQVTDKGGTPSAATPAGPAASRPSVPAGLEPIDRRLDPNAPEARRDAESADPAASADDAGVLSPDDVRAKPPVQPPTEAAPASEKTGLIFERS